MKQVSHSSSRQKKNRGSALFNANTAADNIAFLAKEQAQHVRWCRPL